MIRVEYFLPRTIAGWVVAVLTGVAVGALVVALRIGTPTQNGILAIAAGLAVGTRIGVFVDNLVVARRADDEVARYSEVVDWVSESTGHDPFSLGFYNGIPHGGEPLIARTLLYQHQGRNFAATIVYGDEAFGALQHSGVFLLNLELDAQQAALRVERMVGLSSGRPDLEDRAWRNVEYYVPGSSRLQHRVNL